MVAGRPYTENEIKRALALREQGVSWPTIAVRLGRSSSSLQTTICRYRRYLWTPAKRRDRSAEIYSTIERLVASGVTSIREIGEAIGVSTPAACWRLGRLGLDHEMRLDLAASSKQREAA